MMDPLCPELYSLLLAAFGDVQITKTGQAFDGRYVTDSISGRQRLVGRWGETYSIRCPYCDDRRHHLGVSHRFADFPQLAKCLRRDCLRERRNRNDLTFRVFGLTGPRHLTIKPGVVVATTDISGNLLPVTPPGVVYPLSQLGSVHPANVYLAGRGFDPLELSRIYDVHWCFSSPDGIAQNRIIMPVRQQGRVVGWQGRFVGDNWKEVGTPKYYGPSLPKSQLLYGLDDACQHRFAVVCEGVTDVWRVGPPAVAIFGHDLSAAQRQLLFR